MQAFRIAGAALFMVALSGAGVIASTSAESLTFAVMRNGAQIGTNSVTFDRSSDGDTVQTVTHVSVGLGFITFYRFDQTETEQWAGGHLVALSSTTDDNGTVHRASAAAHDGKLELRCDNKVKELAPTTIPLNLWNVALIGQTLVLDPEDGSVQPLKVFDRGEENVAVRGKTRRAHHYQIVTTYPQDVWYDDKNGLVQVELKGSDGSTIRYQLM